MPVEQIVYTDRVGGKGFDPSLGSSIQLAACSDGLDEYVRVDFYQIHMHLGKVLYLDALATKSLRKKVEEWDIPENYEKNVPEEYLREFPDVWSYLNIRDDLYAMSHVRFTGRVNDGRIPNFFAHSLVFSPSELKSLESNPQALIDSDLILRDLSDDVTRLPSLQDLGSSGPPQPEYDLLARSPYRDHLAGLISALMNSPAAGRSVLLCIADWRQAVPIVNALLSLLPPSTRRRTTFVTYEGLRDSFPQIRAADTSGKRTGHQLVVQCCEDPEEFKLGPGDINKYMIFDFVGGDIRGPEDLDPYAVAVASWVTEGNTEILRKYHSLVEKFGFGNDTGAWSTLIPAAGLFGPDYSPKALSAAIKPLITLAVEPDQVSTALEFILPLLPSLVKSGDPAPLVAIAADIAILTDRLPVEVEDGPPPHFISEVHRMAGEALEEGLVRNAAALLDACGNRRSRIFIDILNSRLKAPPQNLSTPSSTDDWRELTSLLLEGLNIAERDAGAVPTASEFLIATFHAAGEAGNTAEIWTRVSDALVKPLFEGEWDADKENHLRVLRQYIHSDTCPEGYTWLNILKIRNTQVRDGQLISLLVELAGSCSRCKEGRKLITELMQIAREQLTEIHRFAVLTGRMAEAAYGTPVGDILVKAYRDAMKEASPQRLDSIRQALAKNGVIQVLCNEMLDSILPWDEGESPSRFKSWHNSILAQNVKILNELRTQVASRLMQAGRLEKTLPLAIKLLPSKPGNKARDSAEPGVIALFEAVVSALPLEPLPQALAKRLESPPRDISRETAKRLQLQRFMRKLANMSRSPDWGLADFPLDDPAWHNVAHNLAENERYRFIVWCIGTCSSAGITTPEEAVVLVKVLSAAGDNSPETIGLAVNMLLYDRDPVTRVWTATTFARCGLEGTGSIEKWGEILGAVIRDFDKDTRRLLVSHLEKRFQRRHPDFERRLDVLKLSAGLGPRRPRVPGAMISGDTPARSTDQVEDRSNILDQVKDLAGNLKNMVTRFVGHQGKEPEKPDRKDEDGKPV